MRKTICRGINFFLETLGLTLQEKKVFSSLLWEREALAVLYQAFSQRIPKACKYPAEGIVFSKDRALQLHALLASYYEKVTAPIPLHILYDTSSPAHQAAYEEVFSLFAGRQASFTKQKSNESFADDLIKLLGAIEAEKVLFLVDDNLFIEEVDMRDFTKYDTDKFVPSLRMGLNLDRCYVLQQKQPLPALWRPEAPEEKDKLCWHWHQGVLEWGYPLSVDGHLFSTQEMTAMAKLISFRAPNTFEDNLQKFYRLFSPRLGVSYRKSRIVNIPCNKVQKENDNICGNVTPDFLLEKWQQGLQMNYRQLYGFQNNSVHQDIAFELIPR